MQTTPTKATMDEFTASELLAWYNANSGEAPVKRFADRAAAERRVLALLAAKGSAAKRLASPTASSTKHAVAVKASWTDAKVRTARSARHNVRVSGVLYESVLKAFIALKLDQRKHQRIRREVVAQGSTTFEGHKFVLAPKED